MTDFLGFEHSYTFFAWDTCGMQGACETHVGREAHAGRTRDAGRTQDAHGHTCDELPPTDAQCPGPALATSNRDVLPAEPEQCVATLCFQPGRRDRPATLQGNHATHTHTHTHTHIHTHTHGNLGSMEICFCVMLMYSDILIKKDIDELFQLVQDSVTVDTQVFMPRHG